MAGANVMELLGHDVMRQFGFVAFAAQVGQVKMTEVGGHHLRGGFGGGFVGEMAVAAKDALLERPGTAGRILQHLHVMIGFQHQNVCGPRAFNDQFGYMSQVGNEPDIAAGGVNQKTDGVLGIVRNGKGVHLQVGDFEARAGFKQVAVEFGLQLKFKPLLGGAIAINRNVQFLRDAGEAINMVTVLVGDENGGKVFRGASDAGEALPDLAWTKPGVHEHAGFCGFEVGAVTGGTAAENGEFNSHRRTLTTRKFGGKFFSRSQHIGNASPGLGMLEFKF